MGGGCLGGVIGAILGILVGVGIGIYTGLISPELLSAPHDKIPVIGDIFWFIGFLFTMGIILLFGGIGGIVGGIGGSVLGAGLAARSSSPPVKERRYEKDPSADVIRLPWEAFREAEERLSEKDADRAGLAECPTESADSGLARLEEWIAEVEGKEPDNA